MADLEIIRYDPRKDKEELEKLIKDFEYRSIYPINLENFQKEISKRVLDLKLRNSILLAKDGGKLIGAGFFTLWLDYLGNIQCYIHDLVVRKEDSFKRGIEEALLRELFKYIKSTLKIDKIGLFARRNDSNYQSLLMKMQIKKSDLDFYEHTL
jgi:ribosomal protein S18 acetylase RimI-like enzyme